MADLPGRLIPANAAMAMLDPNEFAYPTPLVSAGYMLAGLEVPIETEDGDAVADVVGATSDLSRLLIIEGKDGHSPKQKQARRYLRADWEEVLRATGLEVTDLPEVREVHVLYVATDHEADALRQRMEDKSLDEIPVLAVGSKELRLLGESSDPELNAPAWPLQCPVPCPRRLPIDAQSNVIDAFDAVAAELIGHLTRARGYEPEEYVVALEDLVVNVIPAYPHIVDPPTKRSLARLVAETAEAVVHQAPHVFGPTRDGRGRSSIAILATPEAHKLQGRTQSYQAVLRDLEQDAGSTHRAPRFVTLFDLEGDQ